MLTFAALVLLFAIVITGALVRLTESGLGCTDWPECNSKTFVDVSSKHAAIEQINRLFTGAVGVGVIAAVLGSLVRAPRRRDLTWLSLGLVAGVIGQAILGAFVVWSHLNPVLVQGHFLLSMVLMANALVLHRWAARDDESSAAGRWSLSGGGRAVVGLAVVGAIAVVTGTVITGAGPHGGSVDGEPIERLSIGTLTAVRFHSGAVFATIGLTFWLAHRARRSNDKATERALELLILAAIAQGTVGYIQYFSDLPVALVAIHVAGATAVWLAIVNVVLVAGRSSATSSPLASVRS
jgi:heme a synthase